MSDLGIFSINIHSLYLNYGAALHSFAFQRYMDSLGIDSVIVDYKSRQMENLDLCNPAISFLKQGKPLRTVLGALLNTCSYRRKYKEFHRFYNHNCRMIDNNGQPFTYKDFEDNTKKMTFDFDIAVCESDVIWSPKSTKGFDNAFFLNHPSLANKIKVAYSPSISNMLFNSAQENEFKNLISGINYLSAREKQTAEYVQNLTGRSCLHVVDPVFLLNGSDYELYIKKPKYENYILVYNVIKNDRKMVAFAKKIAKNRGLKLVEVSDYVCNKIDHKTLTGRSIEEFLGLIKNCECLITNSFHGLCFAILFKKSFIVLERDGVDLKVKSLLETLDLKDCFISQEKALGYGTVNNYIDWDKVYSNLDRIRKISKDYINDSIVKNLARMNENN